MTQKHMQNLTTLLSKLLGANVFLGGFIGDLEATNQFVEDKVKDWTNVVTTLSDTAKSYPQAAFVALSKSLQFEWSYLKRLITCKDWQCIHPCLECY